MKFVLCALLSAVVFQCLLQIRWARTARSSPPTVRREIEIFAVEKPTVFRAVDSETYHCLKQLVWLGIACSGDCWLQVELRILS